MSEGELRSIAGGRVLPQNIEAERSVIGAVLLREAMLPEVEERVHFSANYFQRTQEFFF